MWAPPGSQQFIGLLFAAEGAIPALDCPLAVVEMVDSREGTAHGGGLSQSLIRATLVGGEEGEVPPSDVRGRTAAAQAAWARRGHPGWSLVQLESRSFVPSCGHSPSVLLPSTLFGLGRPGLGPAFAQTGHPPGWEAAVSGSPLGMVPAHSLPYSGGPAQPKKELGEMQLETYSSGSGLGSRQPTSPADVARGEPLGRQMDPDLPRRNSAVMYRAERPSEVWEVPNGVVAEGEWPKRPRLELHPGRPLPASVQAEAGNALASPRGALDPASGANILSRFLSGSLPSGDPMRVDVPSLSRLLDNFIGASPDEPGPPPHSEPPRVDYEAMLREAYRPYLAADTAEAGGGEGSGQRMEARRDAPAGAPLEATRSAIEQLLRVAEGRVAVAGGSDPATSNGVQAVRPPSSQHKSSVDLLRTLISGEFRIPDAELEKLVTIEPGLVSAGGGAVPWPKRDPGCLASTQTVPAPPPLPPAVPVLVSGQCAVGSLAGSRTP